MMLADRETQPKLDPCLRRGEFLSEDIYEQIELMDLPSLEDDCPERDFESVKDAAQVILLSSRREPRIH
jgi:hypothetical protein